MITDTIDAVNVQNCGQSNALDLNENNHGPLPNHDEEESHCPPGFSGDNCEIIVDVCLVKNPCLNRGICKSKGIEFTCDCPFGFIGENCGECK